MEDCHEISSIVTDTTEDSDETHQEFSTMWRELYGNEEKSKKLSSSRVVPLANSYTSDTVEGNLDSPLFPMQQSLKLRFGSADRREQKALGVDSDSISEFSQPLIPLIQTKAVVDTRAHKTQEKKEADLIESSQSLLPQSHSKKIQLLGHLGLCRSTPPSTPEQNADSEMDTTTVCTKRSLYTQHEEKQPSGSNKGNCHLGPQREITQSQALSSSTEKINARLERLLASLSSAPRKQKRVTEIAVSQCIGKIQDNLHHKFKNKNINQEQQAMLKAHLQTTQACLAKLLNHYKAEKAVLSLSRVTRKSPSTQHAKKATFVELEQRQKELLNLLKRQKSLVDKFKEIVRIQSSINQPQPAKTSHASNSDRESALAIDNSVNCTSQVFAPVHQELDNCVLSGTNACSKVTTLESKTSSNLDEGKHCVVTAYETDKCMQENVNMSQDITTIPDTQEVQSQLTDKLTDENIITEDYNNKTIARKNNIGMKEASVKEQNAKAAPLKSSRVLKRNVPWSPDQEAGKKTKKGISKAICGKAAKLSAVNTDSPEPKSYSEMLWLNMLHKKADNLLVPEQLPDEATDNGKADTQKLLTKTNQMIGSDKEILDINNSTDIQRNLLKSSEAEKLTLDEPRGNENRYSQNEKHKDTGSSERGTKEHALNSKTTMVTEVDCERLAYTCTSGATDFKEPICFTSPQQRCEDADVCIDTSPTATSMSSDVFLVKAKELQRRMKMREKLAQSNAKTPKPTQEPQPTAADLTETVSTKRDMIEGIGKTGRDTISDAIDAVIANSRNTNQGTLHKATLTALGKIRTSEGLVFNTPMQWLSTISDGETKKKRSTYTQILYKGRSMLDICRHQQHKEVIEKQSADNRPTSYQNNVQTASNADKYAYPVQNPVGISEKGVQTDLVIALPKSGQAGYQRHMTADELKLNNLLSTSKIRMLTECDLISCNDLPDNFWTEDYSKVKLSFEMWEIVDKW